jgi:hypothetical protein
VVNYESGSFVALKFHEFDDVPILCARDYNRDKDTVVRKGACYVRSRHKPETSEIPSQSEMRDLLELATEKRLRLYVTTARRAGLDLDVTSGVTDSDLFEAELGDLR